MSALFPPHWHGFEADALFNKQEYSDLVIKTSGKDLRAHRITLCARSEWFGRALGENSNFKEGKNGVIEMYDDDPDALESVIKWMYDDKEPIKVSTAYVPRTWMHSLEIAIVANKYGAMKLCNRTLGVLTWPPADLYTLPERFPLIERLSKLPSYDGRTQKVILGLLEHCFVDFYKDDEFHEWIDGQPRLRDQLYCEHMRGLMEDEGFRARLRKDGEFALHCLSLQLKQPFPDARVTDVWHP